MSSDGEPSTIVDVDGVRVGQWTGDRTGVTVVLCDPGTTGSGEVRGGAPATRELALLEPTRTVTHVDAVVLSGGSAFGLAAADGVVHWLAEQGRGVVTSGGPVPIVVGASIFDLAVSGERPDAASGLAAVRAAGEPLRRGRVGAGAGASVGTWRGVEHSQPGGLGSAAVRVDEATIGALAVVNAVGDVLDERGDVLVGSRAPAGAPAFPDPTLADERRATTLVVLATDARCSKVECHLLAQSGHHGLARSIHPSHTRFDGDLVVALATGVRSADVDRLRVAATDVVAAAVRDAVRQT